MFSHFVDPCTFNHRHENEHHKEFEPSDDVVNRQTELHRDQLMWTLSWLIVVRRDGGSNEYSKIKQFTKESRGEVVGT